MRLPTLALAATLGLAAAASPERGAAQHAREFVFTDVEGHMVLRFAGVGSGGLASEWMDEVINVSLSTMVHDRLLADALFEAEAVDSRWAAATAEEIRTHVIGSGPEFAATEVECRTSTCRVLLEHAERLRVTEHQALMADVQVAVQALVAANPAIFDPVFLLVAYDQDFATPNLKVFLRRAPERR